ncbi:hypothetical protein PG997_006821 [Apiospora hydei]|uniref:Tyrosinase copper-binding domain-containing protein n=1 Tax=Apiospora hydei TaxID=1337664 RepID=A0ABR1WRV1_9PEZI
MKANNEEQVPLLSETHLYGNGNTSREEEDHEDRQLHGVHLCLAMGKETRRGLCPDGQCITDAMPDETLVSTLSATMAAAFSALSLVSWLGSSYLVASAVVQPLCGKLSDMYGRSCGFSVALAMFGLGNVACGIAPHARVLLAGRIIAGLGGGASTAVGSLATGIVIKTLGGYKAMKPVVFMLYLVAPCGFTLSDLDTSPWVTVAILGAMGAGFGSVLTALLISVLSLTERHVQATATSMLYSTRKTGAACGVASSVIIMGLVTAAHAGHQPLDLPNVAEQCDRHLFPGPNRPRICVHYGDGLHQVLLFTAILGLVGLIFSSMIRSKTLSHRTRLDCNSDIHLNQSLPSSKSFRLLSASLYVTMDPIQALKDATNAGIVKGLKDISGVKPRLDIDVMIRDQPDTFNLFILALDKMQKPDFQPHVLRYAEISDCRTGTTTVQEAPRVNFPGIIENGMTSFAYDYSCPIAFTVEKINVRTAPDDKWMAMGNPLHHWEFEKDFVPEKDWVGSNAYILDELLYARDRTHRYPLAGKDKKPSPEMESAKLLNQVLNTLRMDSNRLALAFLLSEAYNDWDLFASNSTPKEGYTSDTEAGDYMKLKASGSLESLHNLYHGLIGGNPKIQRGANEEILVGGGGGHMSKVSTAAFDPVFWMHHGQVERLASIWQAIHRGEEHSWLKKADDRELALFPFRQSAGIAPENMWKADMLRDHETLGYTFDDIQGTKEEIRDKLKDMYSWSIYDPDRRRNCEVKAPADMEPIAVEKTQFFEPLIDEPPILSGQAPGDKLLTPEDKPAPGKHLAVFHPKHNSREWYIDNMVTRQFLNDTFTVLFFISPEAHGAAPDTAHDAFQAPALVGVHHIFTAPAQVCDNCGDHAAAATVVETTIPITSMLIDFRAARVLPSLEPEDVKPFLAKRLKWRICTSDGRFFDPRVMAGTATFKVGISTKCIEDGQMSYSRHGDVIDSIVGSSSTTCDAAAALGDGLEGAAGVFGSS